MAIMQDLISGIRMRVQRFLQMDEIFNQERIQRLEDYELMYSYYQGEQRKQLKVRTGQADDNIAMNFAGLVVDRSISMLLGNGIEFNLPGDATSPEQQLIDEIWNANKKNILLQRAAQYASIFGTGFIKIMPDVYDGKPRLVCLDTRWMEIITEPEDIDSVYAYVMRFNIQMNGEETARRETTERQLDSEGNYSSWLITNEYSNRQTGGKWAQLWEPQVWEYEFPPIIHWQNLPEPADCYGQSDISDVIELQDRVNFIASNISKIIRYHAHPKTWGRGLKEYREANWGADKLIALQGDSSMISNLEMQSDLASSQAYMLALRQSLFDISRTVDITSMADKLGALTNFGLRVLFMDALAKLGAKRELFGDALIELNRRMLVLDGATEPDPGDIVWPDVVPSDEREEVDALKFDLEHNLLSKQTASGIRGYNYEEEQERMDTEKAGEENIGSLILQAFERGG